MKVIRKIEIRHFRSIFEQDFEDLKDFNIFGGRNDAGKSNVLKALNLFFNNKTSFLEDFRFFSDFSMRSKVKSRETKKGRQYISIKIFFDLSEIKGKHALKTIASKNGGLWVERRWWAYNGDGLYEQTIPSFILNAKQGVKRSFSVFLQSIKFVYIPAFKNESVFSHVLMLSAENKGLFLNEKAKDELDKSIATTTKEFSKDFSDITAGIETSVTLPIVIESFWSSLEVNSQFEGSPTVMTRGSRNDYKIKFTSRGEGIKSSFIPVILGWLSKASSNNYWIWGIDEPENSLEAIRADQLFNKFVEYSKNSQIFVSSHSPSFVFPQKNATGSKTYITTQSKPGETNFELISDRSSELESIFGYDYASLLNLQKDHSIKLNELSEMKKEILQIKNETNQAILFVEGKTDEIILNSAWDKLYPREAKRFKIFPKNNAHDVAYALELSHVFEKEFIFGLFDFDYAGFTAWNGLRSKDYVLISTSTLDTCLVHKRNNKKHFALLLPVPSDEVLKKQIVDPTTGKDFADKSKLDIELMFYGIDGLSSSFDKKNAPGGAEIIEFIGNKIKFAENTKKLSANDFKNFRPLFEKVKTLIDA
jgi:hypothetical protein